MEIDSVHENYGAEESSPTAATRQEDDRHVCAAINLSIMCSSRPLQEYMILL